MNNRRSLREELLQKKGYRIMRIAIVVIAAIVVIWSIMRGGNSSVEAERVFVSIEIKCDELSNNMSALTDESIRDYIPEDGYIVRSIDYQIKPGETTAFDITNQVCQDENIQIEYNYTPGYGGYYVKGINYIYEFSAGKNSGWLYRVNDEIPSYSADQLKLQGGEKILWYYTIDYSKDDM